MCNTKVDLVQSNQQEVLMATNKANKSDSDPSATKSQTTAAPGSDPGETSSTVQDEAILAREAGLDNALKNRSVTTQENDNEVDGETRLGPPEPKYDDR
jgi:hypothetical protein